MESWPGQTTCLRASTHLSGGGGGRNRPDNQPRLPLVPMGLPTGSRSESWWCRWWWCSCPTETTPEGASTYTAPRTSPHQPHRSMPDNSLPTCMSTYLTPHDTTRHRHRHRHTRPTPDTSTSPQDWSVPPTVRRRLDLSFFCRPEATPLACLSPTPSPFPNGRGSTPSPLFLNARHSRVRSPAGTSGPRVGTACCAVVSFENDNGSLPNMWEPDVTWGSLVWLLVYARTYTFHPPSPRSDR